MTGNVRLRSDALEWREVEGEIVAVDLRRSTYFAVNQTGTTIWPALSAGATRRELAARLTDAFGIEHARAEQDLDAFLAMLRSRGLLQE